MSKKICCLALSVMLFALGSSVEAQQARKLYRIGLLALATPDQYAPLRKVFEEGLSELGYVEGKNFIMERRYAEGRTEGLSDLATELVRLKLDVIVTGTNSEIILTPASPIRRKNTESGSERRDLWKLSVQTSCYPMDTD